MHLFRSRLSRAGERLVVIVPPEVAQRAGICEGEEIEIAILSSGAKDKDKESAGILVGTASTLEPFERDEDDRY